MKNTNKIKRIEGEVLTELKAQFERIKNFDIFDFMDWEYPDRFLSFVGDLMEMNECFEYYKKKIIKQTEEQIKYYETKKAKK